MCCTNQWKFGTSLVNISDAAIQQQRHLNVFSLCFPPTGCTQMAAFITNPNAAGKTGVAWSDNDSEVLKYHRRPIEVNRHMIRLFAVRVPADDCPHQIDK